MTDDQIKVMKVIFTMFWQSIFSICVLIGWFMVLGKLIDSVNDFNQNKALAFGAIEGCLTATIYVAFRYWFPLPDGK
ncbi:MAG TPA: hypothetical protein VK750_09435 [Cytophagaceae bacterium]|jgi:hypothetical protein|nr:hypothetical protein [Cytophagaceae bacterium]